VTVPAQTSYGARLGGSSLVCNGRSWLPILLLSLELSGCSGAAPNHATNLPPSTASQPPAPAASPATGGSGTNAGAAGSGGASVVGSAAGTFGERPQTAGSSAPLAAAGTAAALPAFDDDAGIGRPTENAGKHTPADPKITFDWEETQPGTQAPDCQAGRYEGTFTCTYAVPGADPSSAVEVSGPVAFTLTQSQNGEFLEISQGQIDGYAALLINFTALLAGKLDCSSNELKATASNGIFGLGDATLLPAGMFAGTLNGSLDPSSTTLTGEWNLMLLEGFAQGGACIGPWTARRVP
jgi:hypothetical protein